MSAENVTESAEFRLHIRNLLYDYSITHLTTNYLTLTENFVCEFIEYLKPVPLRDPYSLVLAVDPFQTFSDLHSLSLLKPYDEIPQTTNEALTYLKKVMGSAVGKSLTDKIAWSDSDNVVSPLEPFIPALTRRARQNTPKLGKKKKGQHLAKHFKELVKGHEISAVPVEPIKDEVLATEEILHLKCQIQPEDIQAVRTLLKSTTDMLRPQQSHMNKYLNHKYLCEIPFIEPIWPEEAFIPIFPKSRLPRSGKSNPEGNLPSLKYFTDIPTVVLNEIQVEELDEDISRQNLIIVDGWETIRSSPPSTPMSRDSDEDDQIDQLFLRSSPNTDSPLAEEIANSKIDPILMPRSRKIGGSSGIIPHILANKTLNSFLEPLLKPTNLSSTAQHSKEGSRQPQSSPTPSSLVGQPPTDLEGILAQETEIVATLDIQEQDLDSELKNLYVGHGLGNMIMKETLDGEEDIFMDVPTLAPPNIHLSNDMYIPVAFSDFLSSTGKCGTKDKDNLVEKETPQPLHKFLKKVRGRESLGLALSWIPFTVDKKLPSAAELIGVTGLLDENQLAGEVNQVKLGQLLSSLDLGEEDNSEKRWSDFDTCAYHPPEVSDGLQILTTRQERRRLAGLEGRLEDNIDSDEDNNDPDSISISQEPPNLGDADSERPAKRRRLENAVSPERMEDEYCFPPSPAGTDYLPDRIYYLDSPALSASDDKENRPPFTSLSSGMMDERYVNYYPPGLEVDLSLPYDQDGSATLQLGDHGSFEPLSFGSLQLAQTSTVHDGKHGCIPDYTQDHAAMDVDQQRLDIPMHSSATLTDYPTQQTISSLEISDRLELAFNPEIASRSLGISAFAQLRAKRITEHIPPAEPDIVPAVNMPQEPRNPPEEIFDQNTIRLADVVDIASARHYYLASVELIQKHALVRALRSAECAVELVERQTLDGVDLILDPHSAIIIFSLFTLPSRCDLYVEKVAQQSWKYSNILVIFEAYPEQHSKRIHKRGHNASTASEPYAYTPPIVKALKKFKRDLTIADACRTKCPDTKVEYAFADDVVAGAQMVRMYGQMAEARDQTEGVIWGERDWLALDISEEEEGRLAGLNGLNHFSASIILCKISLEDFVDISPQERIDDFEGYIGLEPMMACNDDLNARFEAINESSGTLTSDIDDVEYSSAG